MTNTTQITSIPPSREEAIELARNFLPTMSTTPTFGITGATGQLGRKVIASLSDRVAREQIVAIVRDPAKATDLGVAARQGDYGHRALAAIVRAGLHHPAQRLVLGKPHRRTRPGP